MSQRTSEASEQVDGADSVEMMLEQGGLTYTVPGDQRDPRPLWSEWVLTNGLGGYAMGTAAGMPTRRYHGLLVAAMRPPVERVVALSAVAERFVIGSGTDNEREWHLTPFQFRDAPAWPLVPGCGFTFQKSPGRCVWSYSLDIEGSPRARVDKELVFFRDQNTVALRYKASGIDQSWWLDLRPLVALRDFHSLLRRERFDSRYHTRVLENGVLCATREAGVHLTGDGLAFHAKNEHWRSIAYVWEDLRGVDSVESLLCPGVFFAGREDGSDAEVTLWASVDAMTPSTIEDERSASHGRAIGLADAAAAHAGGDAIDADDRLALQRLAVAGGGGG
ncbi:MAG: glycogen debranching enzyme N-terminal domain-containing protein, partial [Planctomycetota bacterium]